MLYVFKLYSPTCHACISTEHLWKMVKREFGRYALFHEISVAEPEQIMRLYNSKEDFYADMINEKFFLPIDLDPSLSKEEKEEYKARGEDKSYGLPCFIFIDTDRLPDFRLMIGGVGIDHTYKDDSEFLRDFRKIMIAFVKRMQGVCFDDWFFRRQFQNPYSMGGG